MEQGLLEEVDMEEMLLKDQALQDTVEQVDL